MEMNETITSRQDNSPDFTAEIITATSLGDGNDQTEESASKKIAKRKSRSSSKTFETSIISEANIDVTKSDLLHVFTSKSQPEVMAEECGLNSPLPITHSDTLQSITQTAPYFADLDHKTKENDSIIAEASIKEAEEQNKKTPMPTISEITPTRTVTIKCSSEQKPEKAVFSIRSSITEKFGHNCTCMLCCTTFYNPLELQSHLVLQTHLPRERLKLIDNFLYPCFNCAQCGEKGCRQQHVCSKRLFEYFDDFVYVHTRAGSPLTCILCEGKLLESINHLILHIVIYHGFCTLSVKERHLNCPFCNAVFKTRNSYVIEAHALDVHLPEFVIKKQKLMHPEDKAHQLIRPPFSCHFENSRYILFPNETSLQNCSAIFSDLPGLIGHLCYAHYPKPKDFFPTKARPITCNACLFRFANRTELGDHVYSAHNSILRMRAIFLKDHDLFEEHCDPTLVCQLCWTNQGSVQRLQTHILVYHVDSWRHCGFCKRELCEPNENVNQKIIYLKLERHVDHHVKHLEEHFNEMSMICQLRKPPHEQVTPDSNEYFFKKVKVNDHKNISSADRTTDIVSKLNDFVETKLRGREYASE